MFARLNLLRLPVASKLIGRSLCAEAAVRPPHVKHKIPQKRASKLLNILQKEEYQRLRAGRDWGDVRPGDSVQIEKLEYATATEIEVVKGVVIGMTRKQADSRIKLLNCEMGTPVERNLCLYSPLIKSIKVLQRAFIHKGKKRVRRAKLYYLKKLHPDFYTVK